MYKTTSLLVEKCRTLRKRGLTLGKIIKLTKLPKTTVYDHIFDLPLSLKTRKRIIEENTRRLRKFAQKRKNIIPKPNKWTQNLVFLIAHFMFDGECRTYGCVYYNRNESLINQVKSLTKEIFNIKPYNWLNKETGVCRISYSSVEFADYVKRKSKGLKRYIKRASLPEKKAFLQAFFDDEGSTHFEKRIVRGFQYNLEILKLVQKLLKDFDVDSKIDEKYKEIVISRKENLIKFREKINFSKGIYINPNRKNSVWKKKLEKKEILDRIISSYQG